MAVRIKKKNNFYFGLASKKGRIYLKRSFSNIFITFADLKGKVIICKTSGSAGIQGTKRRKRAPQSIESIVKSLLPILKLYKIENIDLHISSRISVYFHFLAKELMYYGFKITGLTIRKRLPHNGVRGRKLRRV